jgi:hypothetical protein
MVEPSKPAVIMFDPYLPTTRQPVVLYDPYSPGPQYLPKAQRNGADPENAHERRPRLPHARQPFLFPPPLGSIPELGTPALRIPRGAPFVVGGNGRESLVGHGSRRLDGHIQHRQDAEPKGWDDPISVSMFSPDPLPGMPRALPALHIMYEEPPYTIAAQGLVQAPSPPPSRPPINNNTGRALAPLHTLKRHHPYRRDSHDQKALELLHPIAERSYPGLSESPSPRTTSALYGFEGGPYCASEFLPVHVFFMCTEAHLDT